MKKTQRGKYIVIEGTDGTGKSTQVNKIINWLELKKINAIEISEPGGTPIAEKLRVIIKDQSLERQAETNLLLFTAARVELWTKIDQLLDQGTWVIASRSYLSSLVYQGLAEGLSTKMVNMTTALFLPKDYLNPDLEIILTLDDLAVQKNRLAKRDAQASANDIFESKNDAFQQKLFNGYKTIAKQQNIDTINANDDIENIFDQLKKMIENLL